MLRRCTLVVLLGAASGCGTQSDSEIPPELLAALSQRNEPLTYPTGTTGGAVGDIATNICFAAWDNPVAQQFDPSSLSKHCLGDYYDPEGTEHQLLFVASSAIWCQSCQAEFGGAGSASPISEDIAKRRPRGLRALAGLFQNAQGEPATEDDAVRWAQSFNVDFPFGVDAEFTLGRFAKPDAQPLHMLIDTRTMKIVHKATGGNIALLWEKVDSLLE